MIKIHISIDDCLASLKYLTINKDKYNSIFELYFYGKLKEYHDIYGAKFSLYFYEESKGFNINQVTDKFKKDFYDNKEWLKIGFHGSESLSVNNDNTESTFITVYNNFIEAIKKFAHVDCITDIIRLHRFMGNDNEITFLKDKGIKSLLVADDNRISYNLTIEENEILNRNYKIEKDGMMYIKTNLRLEKMSSNIDEIHKYKKEPIVTIFTHEWAFKNEFSKLDKILSIYNDSNSIFINKYSDISDNMGVGK